MQLAERFEAWDGKDVAFLAEVYDLYAGRDDFHAQVLAALDAEERAQTGATWMLKRGLEEGRTLTRADAARFLARLEALIPWEAQLHALQCLPFVPVPARSRTAVERFVRAALESETRFVRAWAFTGLFELANTFAELRPEAERLMDAALEAGPASVSARIRNLRKQGWG
jgi:hypothetical protein